MDGFLPGLHAAAEDLYRQGRLMGMSSPYVWDFERLLQKRGSGRVRRMRRLLRENPFTPENARRGEVGLAQSHDDRGHRPNVGGDRSAHKLFGIRKIPELAADVDRLKIHALVSSCVHA